MRTGAVKAAVVAVAVVIAWLALRGWPTEQTISSSQFTHEHGAAYVARLQPWTTSRLLRVDVDSAEWPEASHLRLTENARLLGPAHSQHDGIRSLGGGRYSHWKEPTTLYFSTSDGSDPRTNGRTYSASTLIRLHRSFALIAPLLLIALVFSERRRIQQLACGGLQAARAMIRRQAPVGLTSPTATKRLSAPLLRFGRASLPSLVGTLGALLLVLVAGEIYFRLTAPFMDKAWPIRHTDDVGWLFQPNATIRHTNDLDFWVEEKANSLGFLDRERPPSNTTRGCQIALIGDSFVEAAQVKNDQKVQALLERMSAGTPFSISAAGYGFSGTGQLNQLPFYDRFVKATAPNLVVLVFVANDFANNSSVLESVRNGFHPQHPPRTSAVRDPDSGDIRLKSSDPEWQKHVIHLGAEAADVCWLCRQHRRLFDASLFYRWVTAKLRLLAPQLLAPVEPQAATSRAIARVKWLARQPQFAAAFGDWTGKPDIDEMFFLPNLPPVFEEALAFTEFAFAEFKRRVEADGGHLIILSASHVRRPNRSNGDAYFNRMHAIADKLGIPVLDQHAWLARRNEPQSSVAFRHDNHWKARGHQVVAEMILDYVTSHPQVCERRPKS